MLTDIEKKINLIEDLRELRAIQGFVKDRRRAIGNRLKYTLSVGDEVQVSNGSRTDKGTITCLLYTSDAADE